MVPETIPRLLCSTEYSTYTVFIYRIQYYIYIYIYISTHVFKKYK